MNDALDEREAKLGRNESIFRTVNDQIESLSQTFASLANLQIGIVCECGDISCAEHIQIQSDAYARVRNDPTLFLLVPGHENPTVEAVIESDQAAYVVVRKPAGTPAERAANKDPSAGADPP